MSTYIERADTLLDNHGLNAVMHCKDYLHPTLMEREYLRTNAEVGDTIIYGNNTRSKIINILKVNGVLSFHMECSQYDSMSSRFRDVKDMKNMLAMGVFKLEKAS